MCHKTAGLVANALEKSGIATVVIGTMHKPLQLVSRGFVTPYRDAPMGPAGAVEVHAAVLTRALELLRTAKQHVVADFAPLGNDRIGVR